MKPRMSAGDLDELDALSPMREAPAGAKTIADILARPAWAGVRRLTAHRRLVNAGYNVGAFYDARIRRQANFYWRD